MRVLTVIAHQNPNSFCHGMNPRQRVLDGAGGPVRRFLAARALRGKDDREIATFIRERGPKDIAEHWKRVERAEGLAFIAPVFWLGYPAMMKGWFERVFNYGNAFAFDREGWEGKVSGRIGLLRHEKALVMTPTLFGEDDYDADWRQPMTRIVDDWGLRYPGVKQVEHVYFYRAAIADPETLEGYLAKAYELGANFSPKP